MIIAGRCGIIVITTVNPKGRITLTTISPQKMKRAAIIMILLGAFFATGFLQNVGSWPLFCSDKVTVQATVISNDETYNQRGSRRYGNLYSYTPHVTYTVYGKEYRDVKVYDDMPRYSPAPVGSTITLMVNGKKPTKILREPGVQTYVFGSLSFFFVVFGVLMIRAVKNGQY